MLNSSVIQLIEDTEPAPQVVTTNQGDRLERLELLLGQIEGADVSVEEFLGFLSEIDEAEAVRLLTTGMRRGLAYSNWPHMELDEAQALAYKYVSHHHGNTSWYTHGEVPKTVEGVVTAWSGRVTNSTFELLLYSESTEFSSILLIVDED